MKREEIEKLLPEGTDKAVIDKIMELNGKDVEKFKTDLASTTTERDTLKTSLDDANKQIESFKSMDIEGVKKTADEYKTKFETTQAESAKQLAALKFDHALDGALTGAKAKNLKAVKALLNTETLKLNEADGSIIGLKDQLEGIQKDNGFLFESETQPPEIVIGGNNQPINLDSVLEAAKIGAGLPTKDNGK